MLNSRNKGYRVQRKAVQYALTYPGVKVLPVYQISRWAQPQPFDLIVFRPNCWLIFVEVRANQWRTGRPSTVELTQLPGEGYHKQIWMFPDHAMIPQIREWNGREWVSQAHPWEAIDEMLEGPPKE